MDRVDQPMAKLMPTTLLVMEVILSVPSVLHPIPLSQSKEVQPLGHVVEVMVDQALLAGLVATLLQSMDRVDRPMAKLMPTI
jgi:hypothetical protein